MIKYSDEDVLLNDIVHFRIELDLYPKSQKYEFFFECELIFADLNKIGLPKNDGKVILYFLKSFLLTIIFRLIFLKKLHFLKPN